jgi:hypothetical protein
MTPYRGTALHLARSQARLLLCLPSVCLYAAREPELGLLCSTFREGRAPVRLECGWGGRVRCAVCADTRLGHGEIGRFCSIHKDFRQYKNTALRIAVDWERFSHRKAPKPGVEVTVTAVPFNYRNSLAGVVYRAKTSMN